MPRSVAFLVLLLTGCATQRIFLFTDAAAPLGGAPVTPLFPIGPARRQVTRMVAAPDLARMAGVSRGAVVTLALFPDATFVATTEEVSREGEVVGWRGRLQGAKVWGAATLAISAHGVMGTVQFDERIFALRPLASGETLIAEIAQDQFPKGCKPRRRSHPVPPPPPAPAAGPTELSLLLVFPDQSNYCLPWTSAFLTLLTKLSLNGVWSAFNDQPVTVGNVSIICPDHTPVGGDLDADLTWVMSDPGVAAQRATTKSDLVSAFVPTGDVCGQANFNYPTTADDAGTAFSVVLASCAFEEFGLAHEIGHNLGLDHDRFREGGGVADDCNYGFNVLVGGLPIMRTVMAEDDFCQSLGLTCPTIGVYSNPIIFPIASLQFGIDCSVMQTGSGGSANNVGQLLKAAPVAAGWQ